MQVTDEDIKEAFTTLFDFVDPLKTIVQVYKRVSNITRGQHKDTLIDPKLLVSQYELHLAEAINNTTKKFASLELEDKWTDIIVILIEIKPVIYTFLDNIKILDNDELYRHNRIALLNAVKYIFMKVADFSKINI